MADNQNISPDDQDLQLARLIGDALPDLNSISATSDSLLNTLLEYKNDVSVSASAIDIDSASLWDSINSSINSDKKSARILHLSPAIRRYAVAVAAALLITAFAGIFFYQNLSTPELIGESFSSAEIITLPDGSEVTLRPYSKLYEVSLSETEANYKLDGEAFFNVTTEPNRTFSVRTNQSEVRVLGTRFVLSNWGNSSTVYLQEGRIQYTSLENQQSIVLEPGQSSTINETTPVPEVSNANEDIYTDWLNNQLVFQNESVANIFAELEQHFNITIQAQPAVLQENLSGSIQLDELNAVLGDLELVLGGSFEPTESNSFVFSSN